MSSDTSEWRDAQKEKPKNLQFCVVIGETKTTNTISPYVTFYLENLDQFQHLGKHKIFIPRSKARWWLPISMPPVDEDS